MHSKFFYLTLCIVQISCNFFSVANPTNTKNIAIYSGVIASDSCSSNKTLLIFYPDQTYEFIRSCLAKGGSSSAQTGDIVWSEKYRKGQFQDWNFNLNGDRLQLFTDEREGLLTRTSLYDLSKVNQFDIQKFKDKNGNAFVILFNNFLENPTATIQSQQLSTYLSLSKSWDSGAIFENGEVELFIDEKEVLLKLGNTELYLK